jgi:hypothetical protein
VAVLVGALVVGTLTVAFGIRTRRTAGQRAKRGATDAASVHAGQQRLAAPEFTRHGTRTQRR